MDFIRKFYGSLLQSLCGMLLLSPAGMQAFAQPLEDVYLKYQETGIVATIRLSSPVRYLRHFPISHGKVMEIFYERVAGATDEEPWFDNEVRKSPPSVLIPSFTVTTRNQQSNPKLVVEFERDADYSVAPGKDNRSLTITIRRDRLPSRYVSLPLLPTIAPEKSTSPTATLTKDEATLAANNQQAHVLMVQAREALASDNNIVAVDTFNKLLLLPPNDYTQVAQEWVGVARERAEQFEKARVEYDLYLRLYPEGEGALRVVQRLTALASTTEPEKTIGKPRSRPTGWITFGSVSPRYYYSHSKIDSTDIFNNAPSDTTFSLVDQSMLITSLNASGRYTSATYSGRLFFSGVDTRNFLASQSSQHRVNAAYGEIKDRSRDYSVRVGRQSSTGSGVLGRFDGLAASYGVEQVASANVVGGVLSDYSQGSKPVFVGGSANKGPVWLYAINQRVEGTTDRRALGAEFRYYQGSNTAFALLDYDIYFNALNAAQVIGTMGAYGGTVNFMLDHRKAPTLSVRNALSGAGTSSVDALLQIMSTSSLRDLARARTYITNVGQVGISVPIHQKWQMAGDIRLTNTTGLPTSGTNTLEGILQATEGRGTEKSMTGQLIGNGLYTDHDIWSGSITFNSSSTVNGFSIYLYNYTILGNAWTLNTSLQFYRQKDQFDGTTSRFSPMVRGSYRIKDQLYIDLDGGVERSDFKGVQQTSITTRTFYSAGLRWDF